jgi:hypothetical protein
MKIVDGKEVLEPGDEGYKPTAEEIQAQVNAQVEAQLKDIKDKLDNAFKARDAANARAAELEAKNKQAEIKALEDAGKHTEVMQMKLDAALADLNVYKDKVVKYERDGVVRDAMKDMKFRNDRSREMAYNDIVGQLQQNEKGEWVHKTGVAIKDFATQFSKDEQNSFLFETKQNGGGGTSAPGQASAGKVNKKVTEMTTQELLQAAQSGQFGQLTSN